MLVPNEQLKDENMGSLSLILQHTGTTESVLFEIQSSTRVEMCVFGCEGSPFGLAKDRRKTIIFGGPLFGTSTHK